MNAPLQSMLRRLLLILAMAAAVVLAGLLALPFILPKRNDQNFPLPPFTKSDFLNATADAEYIGMKNCIECHRDRYASYSLTAHSKALADLVESLEPPSGSFHHAASGRSYRVYRHGDQFKHEEVLRTQKGEVIAKVDLPIRYLIGSGQATRSYLVEVDGFLHESPITWYTARKCWDMSPGYDIARHMGFERPVDVGCLMCHTGRTEPKDDCFNRVWIREQNIGCESCHGPGSLHAAFHRANKKIAGGRDLTIVNPRYLSRQKLESICAQCHLRGDATIVLRGRKIGEFRPGRPITDYRVDYQLQSDNTTMKVVGHLEQLRISQCWKQSKTLTCITCHDPHASSKPKHPIGFYRKICLDCHKPEACGIETSQRLKQNARDDCLHCHMPRGGTDIPHIAFTHHRIGVHKQGGIAHDGPIPQLAPMEDVSHLPEIDRKRNLGLAYAEITFKQKNPTALAVYSGRAKDLLEAVQDAGLRDGETDEALARLYFGKDNAKAVANAKFALNDAGLSPVFRINALFIIAEQHYRSGDAAAAIGVLKEITRVRRHSEDWLLLGSCYLQLKQTQEAIKALRHAASINPFRADVHDKLAEALRQNGNNSQAAQHRQKARQLSSVR